MKRDFTSIVRCCMGLLFLTLTTQSSFSQDKTEEIDRIFSWATAGNPGCACAVSQNGKVIVDRAYGSADLERDVAMMPSSVFDAGSLTKQFVAAAVLILVEDGKLSLSDDVRKFIPELPDYKQKVTINHLLTHTSGIRDWTGLLPLANGDVDAFNAILRQRELNFAPGEEFSYSNSGYVLLKEIVARISKMPFGEFAAKKIFDPLGMKQTTYTHNLRAIVKNRALAYEKENGKWRMAMMLDNDRGGGGALLSTAGDLLTWNDAITNSRLSAFVSEKLQERTKLNNGRNIDYGRGLFHNTYRGANEVWHTGSADGYKSFLGRYPQHGLSIAIMCNSGDGTDRRNFARRIFDLLVPAAAGTKAESNIPPAVTDIPGLDLNSKAGLFVSETNGDHLRLAVDNGRLRFVNGPGLLTLTKERFKLFGSFVQFMSQDEIELNFISNDKLELKSKEGQITTYRRARAYAPTQDELNKFSGRYESDEIGTIIEITPAQDGLKMNLAHSPGKTLALKPVDTETFQFNQVTVRFVKNSSGKVVGLDLSNPLLRRVKFEKIEKENEREKLGRKGSK